MSDLEVGLSIRPAAPADDIADIVAAEREGFDLGTYGDSQNAFANPFARMTVAAAATSTIRFVTCGVPPGTRLPPVTAAAALTVQSFSAGRALLGLARGDSALYMIGRPSPAPLAEFTEYVRQVRDYLHGTPVDCNGVPSQIKWRPADLPTVPIDISCTGPRVIRYAASVADRVSFAVGADPERVGWALGIARDAAAQAGRDPNSVQYGAWLNVAVDDDVDAASETMRKEVNRFAHFLALEETRVQEHPPPMRRVTEPLRLAYLHRDREPVDCIDPEFVRYFGIVGPPDEVVAKITALHDLGLGHVYILNGTTPDRDFTAASRARLAAEVLPALHGAAG